MSVHCLLCGVLPLGRNCIELVPENGFLRVFVFETCVPIFWTYLKGKRITRELKSGLLRVQKYARLARPILGTRIQMLAFCDLTFIAAD